PVSRVRRIGDQLAQEDFLIAIQGMDHQVQDLRRLGLETVYLLSCPHRHPTPPRIPLERSSRGPGVRVTRRQDRPSRALRVALSQRSATVARRGLATLMKSPDEIARERSSRAALK